jgi:cell division protein FtsA
VATPYARGLNSRGCIGISHEDKIVRGGDARHALAAANRVSLPSDRSVTEVYSQGFSVDDVHGVHNPVGMACGRLEAGVHVVTDTVTGQVNMGHVLEAAGYRLERAVVGPIAAASGALSEEEKRLGGVHIDIGAGTTSVTLFAGGYPRFFRVLPVGGQHVTNDLAIGLNTTVVDAELLKRRFGLGEGGSPRRRSNGPKVGVPVPDSAAVREVPLWRLHVIIRARVEEILEMVVNELGRSGVAEAACARAVLTGGFWNMQGARAVAKDVLGRPVRFGRIEMETTLAQFESGPDHAQVLGTVQRGVYYRDQRLDRRFEEGGLRGLLNRVAGWL